MTWRGLSGGMTWQLTPSASPAASMTWQSVTTHHVSPFSRGNFKEFQAKQTTRHSYRIPLSYVYFLVYFLVYFVTMTTHFPRQHPIILLTGTPGTGKSTHASLLAASAPASSPLVHLNVGEIVKEEGLHEGWDEDWGCWIVDEDRVSSFISLRPPGEPCP
jgi:hypothetical protein